MAQIARITPIHKETATVPYSEVEPLLNQLRTATSSSTTQILRTIGYDSSSSAARWQEQNKAPLRVKYALIGMAAELRLKAEMPPQPAAPKQFSSEDLIDLLIALQGRTLPPERQKALTLKVLGELTP